MAVAEGYLLMEKESQEALRSQLFQCYREDQEAVRVAILDKEFAMQRMRAVAQRTSQETELMVGLKTLYHQFAVDLVGMDPPAGWRIAWVRDGDSAADGSSSSRASNHPPSEPSKKLFSVMTQTNIRALRGGGFRRDGARHAEAQTGEDEEHTCMEEPNYDGDEEPEGDMATNQRCQGRQSAYCQEDGSIEVDLEREARHSSDEYLEPNP